MLFSFYSCSSSESRLLLEKAELSEKNTMLTKAVMDKSRIMANALRSKKLNVRNVRSKIRGLLNIGSGHKLERLV